MDFFFPSAGIWIKEEPCYFSLKWFVKGAHIFTYISVTSYDVKYSTDISCCSHIRQINNDISKIIIAEIYIFSIVLAIKYALI